jgi:type IV pilus assembly protein PilV
VLRIKSIVSDKGFTLLEVMIAIVIFMVGMLGLLQTVSTATSHNLRNHLRDAAVQAGEKYMNYMRGKKFDNYSAPYPAITVPANIRGTNHKLTIERTVLTLGGGKSKQLRVVVKWRYKSEEFQNNVESVVTDPSQ